MNTMRTTYCGAARRWPLMLALVAGLLAAGSGLARADGGCDALSVADAWIRAPAGGAPVMGGYMQVTNTGTQAVTLAAVSSPQFDHVQMHESTVNDQGMASMQPVAKVVVAADETVAFAPGGYHLMLFDPQQALAAGDTVTLMLQCAAGGTTQVSATVRDMLPNSKKNMQHMHHAD